MKNFKPALLIGFIFCSAVLAYFFVANSPEKNSTIAQNQATQEDAETQPKNIENNSFSAGSFHDKGQDNLAATETVVDKGKSFLLKQVDSRIGQLGPFKGKLEQMASLNEADRNSLVSELNAEIAMFETLKTEVIQSASKEDVKNVADKIKAEWLKSRESVNRAEGLMFASKENQLLADADAASLGIQKRIAALKAEGKDAKKHEQLLSAYNQKIAAAKQDVKSAKEKFSAAASTAKGDEKEKLIKANHDSLASAQNNLKDAYKMLKEEAQADFARKFK